MKLFTHAEDAPNKCASFPQAKQVHFKGVRGDYLLLGASADLAQKGVETRRMLRIRARGSEFTTKFQQSAEGKLQIVRALFDLHPNAAVLKAFKRSQCLSYLHHTV